jgi:hypothetical protein
MSPCHIKSGNGCLIPNRQIHMLRDMGHSSEFERLVRSCVDQKFQR